MQNPRPTPPHPEATWVPQAPVFLPNCCPSGWVQAQKEAWPALSQDLPPSLPLHSHGACDPKAGWAVTLSSSEPRHGSPGPPDQVRTLSLATPLLPAAGTPRFQPRLCPRPLPASAPSEKPPLWAGPGAERAQPHLSTWLTQSTWRSAGLFPLAATVATDCSHTKPPARCSQR